MSTEDGRWQSRPWVRRLLHALMALAVSVALVSTVGFTTEEHAGDAASGSGVDAADQNPGARDRPGEGESRTCKASYFGGPKDTSVGSHMANGEKFDWHKDLVAHRTLPFGSLVTITRDGTTVEGVPVKDNGPSSTKAGDVCIDLTYALFAKFADPDERGHIIVTFTVTKLNGKHRAMVV